MISMVYFYEFILLDLRIGIKGLPLMVRGMNLD